MKTRFTLKCLVLTMLSILLLETGCGTIVRDTAIADTLHLAFESDHNKVRVGEPIHMWFSIKNVGSKRQVIESKNTPVIDIHIDEVGGGTLFAWSEQNPDKVSHLLEWQPGESKTIEWSWTPKESDVYIGAYHDLYLIGILSGIPGLGVSTAGIRVCASNVCR